VSTPHTMESILPGARKQSFEDLEAGARTSSSIPVENSDQRHQESPDTTSTEKSSGPEEAWVGECPWYPNGETREQCQERFMKDINEQKLRYSNMQFRKQS
jgi:hypothetical protein